jgi:hypothetical protein
MILIRIIILFFILLIGFQIYSMLRPSIEGLENAGIQDPIGAPSEPTATTDSSLTYQPYNKNDPNSALILSQQNAGNIEYLKGRVSDLDKNATKIDAMSQNMGSMQTQIDAMMKQQAEYANSISTAAPIEAGDGQGGQTEPSQEETEK